MKLLSLAALAACLGAAIFMRSDAAMAAPADRFFGDTGVVKLGPDQKLRVIVYGGGGSDTAETRVRFVQQQYIDFVMCNPGEVCSLQISASHINTAVMAANQSLMVERSSPTGAVRITVEADRKNTRAIAEIVDISTGEVQSIFITVEALP